MITINCLLRNSRISLTHWGVKGRVLLFERDERKGDLLQKVFSFWELVQTDFWSYVKAMANLIVALCDDAFTIFCMDLQSFTRKCNSKFESGLCSFRSESVHSVEEPLVPTIVSDLVSLPCHFCVPYVDKHLQPPQERNRDHMVPDLHSDCFWPLDCGCCRYLWHSTSNKICSGLWHRWFHSYMDFPRHDKRRSVFYSA